VAVAAIVLWFAAMVLGGRVLGWSA
jgi:hypothetical protein